MDGSTTKKPSSRSVARFRATAGARSMPTFIDGATITGARVVSAVAATTSLKSPRAMREIVVPDAG